MIRSEQEKFIYHKLVGVTSMELLPYRLTNHWTEKYGDEFYYQIPDEKKEEVFNQLWPFINELKMEDEVYDIHEERKFKVKDFIVIRFDSLNMIVSPYYWSSGGTLLDFLIDEDSLAPLFFK